MNSESLKNKIKIFDVIKNYVKLSRKGGNFMGLCPFHNDNNPSLSVSESKNIFKCFTCNVAGDAISFIMKYDNISYNDAFIKALNYSGINPEIYKNLLINNQKLKPLHDLYKLTDYVTNCYAKFLKDKKNANVLKYLIKERKIDQELIDKFKIGYAPKDFGKNILSQLITNHNKLNPETQFSEKQLVDCGLSKIDENGLNYDFFFDRIIFPIHNIDNHVVGYSARVYKTNNSQAKYLNSPESLLFKKQEILYNANNLIKNKYEFIYLVEGFMDVIAYEKIEISNSIATMGTSFSVKQLNIIKNYFGASEKKIVLSFDNDDAGINFSESLGLFFLRNNIYVDVVDFWDFPKIEKDVDEICKTNDQAKINQLKNPVNYFKWIRKKTIVKNPKMGFDEITKKIQELLNVIFNFSYSNPSLIVNLSSTYLLESIKEIFSFYDLLKDPKINKIKEEQLDYFKNLILNSKVSSLKFSQSTQLHKNGDEFSQIQNRINQNFETDKNIKIYLPAIILIDYYLNCQSLIYNFKNNIDINLKIIYHEANDCVFLNFLRKLQLINNKTLITDVNDIINLMKSDKNFKLIPEEIELISKYKESINYELKKNKELRSHKEFLEKLFVFKKNILDFYKKNLEEKYEILLDEGSMRINHDKIAEIEEESENLDFNLKKILDNLKK